MDLGPIGHQNRKGKMGNRRSGEKEGKFESGGEKGGRREMGNRRKEGKEKRGQKRAMRGMRAVRDGYLGQNFSPFLPSYFVLYPTTPFLFLSQLFFFFFHHFFFIQIVFTSCVYFKLIVNKMVF